jgi:hypothetical protein
LKAYSLRRTGFIKIGVATSKAFLIRKLFIDVFILPQLNNKRVALKNYISAFFSLL